MFAMKNPAQPSRVRQFIHATVTGVVFMVVYGGTSWLTSIRAPVPTIYFEWERYIPFLPWMVIPYMSIDVFFVTAPFLCTTQSELQLLSRRIVFAIVVAGTCFLLYPLQLAVERPIASGTMGEIYNWFCSLDCPYNLCPSLHIELRTLLAYTFAKHTRGMTNILMHGWFSLIGFSTLTLYQHHVIDIAGGFVLAIFCFYLIRTEPILLPVVPNFRVSMIYSCMIAVCVTAIVLVWPLGLVFVWPAIGLSLLVAGYLGAGPGLFRKSDGSIPLSAKIVLAPLLIGQWLSLRYYLRQCRAWDRVTDRVWIGRILTDDEAGNAVRQGVTHVLDLTAEFSEAKPFRNCAYRNLQVLDLTAPTQDQLQQAVSFVDKAQQAGTVYVHCKIGYSRSAAVICAWLLSTRRTRSVKEAIDHLRFVRPSVVIRPEILIALNTHQEKWVAGNTA